MPIRVLIVDDSVVVRKFLTDIVAKDPEFELAGVASTGSIALQKLTQVQPDIVVMDVEMPGMDGIEAVASLRVDWPKLPVLMCSAITARGADATLRALAAGATDYVAKPSTLGASGGIDAFEKDFRDKLKELGGGHRKVLQLTSPVAGRPPQLLASGVRPKPPTRPSVLAIGCSTGGPNALARVFQDLPADIGVPIVITQHMPPLFTKMLGERLTANSRLKVTEARPGDVLEPGRGYIAPGDFHMGLERSGADVRIVVNQDPPEHSCRPSVDVMFRSVAKIFGSDVVAAVMTGMGRDGSIGSRAIADVGGWVITQEAASCVVPSMPNAVVEIGASCEAADLDHLGTLFAMRCRGAARIVGRA